MTNTIVPASLVPQDVPGTGQTLRKYYETRKGIIYHGDSRLLFEKHVAPLSVDLILTSPPFGLVRKKSYGNVDAHEYLDWFRPFGEAFFRALKPSGSLVIDIGGAWNPGKPTRSLYHYELLIMLCRECGFHLAQDFFWWNPAKLPTPAEWVTVRRIRVKDAVNCIWWLSKTAWPKASKRRVLVPYSESMKDLLKNGYQAKLRPSGHDISGKFAVDNKAAISPNLIAAANTESNSFYLRYCTKHNLAIHPARFPSVIPEYFIRMLTDPGDLVIDPFAGSCVTGEVAERLGRKWICGEIVEEYLRGALVRFLKPKKGQTSFFDIPKKRKEVYYSLSHPANLWQTFDDDVPLLQDGGRSRSKVLTAESR